MFLFVYRPTFTRDMPRLAHDCNGTDSYCPRTLLKVLYAHSCRFLRGAPELDWDPTQHHHESFQQLADRLMSEAKTSLAMETLNPPSIPTIQALLQQSARDIACGRSSQAWTFSGMAFRMAIDLGVHISTDKLQQHAKSLSPGDIEVRKRLFWSLYAWDKHISLYLGRMPNFVLGAEKASLDFLDDFTETEPWEPFYGPDPTAEQLPSYQPTPGRVISCFAALCRLCQIINRLMLQLYSPQPTTSKESATARVSTEFAQLSNDLKHWWTTLSSFLQIPPDNLPPLSPPPHITSLNLIYHTSLILLHRPLVARNRSPSSLVVQRSWQACRAATAAICDLLRMYVNTFGIHHITYMNSYCTYTAATTAVYQLEINDHPSQADQQRWETTAWSQLKFLLDILQRTATAMPGLNRSIAIIRTRIKGILDNQAERQLHSLFPTSSTSRPSRGQAAHSFSGGRLNNTAPNDNPGGISPSLHENSLDPANYGNCWESWLPAFPGQDVSYGAGSMFDVQQGFSPMISALDPHVQSEPFIAENTGVTAGEFMHGPFASPSRHGADV